MKKKVKNPWQRIKKFILQTIRIPQKKFTAEGEAFLNGRPTGVKNNMVAFNEKKVIKVENFAHWNKANNLSGETKIIEFLNKNNVQSCPKLYGAGTLKDKRPYIIMEKVTEKGSYTEADITLSLLEQHSVGIYHGDLKDDNIIFNGNIAKFIDYDQAEYIEEIKKLNGKESVLYFIEKQSSNWGAWYSKEKFGDEIKNVIKKYLSHFVKDRFNFEKTVLHKNIISNCPQKKLLYSINHPKIFADGIIDIEKIKAAIDKIEFKDNEKILDFGCNIGCLTFYLSEKTYASQHPQVTSYDSSIALTGAKMLSNISNHNTNFTDILSSDVFDRVFIMDENLLKEKIQYLSSISKKIITRCKEKNAFIQNFSQTNSYPSDDGHYILEFIKD